jgi:alpha-N-arabinofuranosidase
MFMESLGDWTVLSSATGLPTQTNGDKTIPALFYVATRDSKSGMIYLKVVNPQAVAQSVDFSIEGAKTVQPNGSVVQLTGGSLKDMNTLAEPKKVSPREMEISGLSPKFTMSFPALSVTVVKIKTQ